MRWIAVTCILLSCHYLSGSEEQGVKRIYSQLNIHDPWSAVVEGEALMQLYPGSAAVKMAYLEALAEKGDERALFQEWMKHKDIFSLEKKAVEIVAWATLHQARRAPQLSVQTAALIGSALTSDVKAIPLVVSALRSQNALLRFLGVKLSRHLGDDLLVHELIRLFQEEKVWFVREMLIEIIGELRIEALKDPLFEAISTTSLCSEEQAKMMMALTHLCSVPTAEHLQFLFSSPKAVLREFGCHLVAYYDLTHHIPDVTALLNDYSLDVRQEAIETLIFLEHPIPSSILKPLIQDRHPQVALTAAWAACCLGEQEGIEVLQQGLTHAEGKWQRLAAALLSRSGRLTQNLAITYLHSHDDEFVKVNLALGLIEQQVAIQQGCEVIDQFLHQIGSQKLMWDSSSSQKVLAPSEVRHLEQSYNYPQMIDHLTKLDLMSLLCTLQYEGVKQQIKELLKSENLEVTACAGVILFQEGDEEIIPLLKQLTLDPNPSVQAQAALILTVCTEDEEALKILQSVYDQVGYEVKIQILEVISQRGTKDVIPFLLARLEEPFQLLRVIAASSLIQCLSR
ncbi:MAG: hypothetical protein QRY72_02935 [Candidatus Rhabdochlamydia sp.]